MKDSQLWFGYLQAGEKSSHVVMDQQLSTGNPVTLYLFNIKRNEIIEYNRAIVEAKLRELKKSESAMVKELESAYLDARRSFKSKTERAIISQERELTPRKTARKASVEDFDTNEDIGVDLVDESWDISDDEG